MVLSPQATFEYIIDPKVSDRPKNSKILDVFFSCPKLHNTAINIQFLIFEILGII